MARFPAGIEFFKGKRPDIFGDSFSRARAALHDKLAMIADPEAIFAIPRSEFFEQVGIVVDELLEFEDFEFDTREQAILSRVLAFDLIASQVGKKRLGHAAH